MSTQQQRALDKMQSLYNSIYEISEMFDAIREKKMTKKELMELMEKIKISIYQQILYNKNFADEFSTYLKKYDI